MHILRRDLAPEQMQKLNRVGDVMILCAASAVASVENDLLHWKVAAVMAATATAIWCLASRALRHYDPANGRGALGDLALLCVLLVATVTPLALLRLVIPHYAATTDLARFLAVVVSAAVLLRLHTTNGRLWHSRPMESALIVGTGPLGRLTGNELSENQPHQRLLGYLELADDAPNARLRAPVLGGVGDLETVLKERVVDEVYFATTSGGHAPEVQAAIKTCEKMGMPFALPACSYRVARAKPVCADSIADGYLHYLNHEPNQSQRWLKRLFDIVASGAALCVLTPLLLLVAAAVKLTSRGPIIFRQERAGKYGRMFNMLKFRSMVVNAEELKARLMERNEQSGPVFKMRRDPRVTTVGRFIRKFSIDELPQLVNVLRGDMSIVGPRPPLPGEVARYEAWQRRRLSVRPGLTCVWQVSGRNQISFEEWMLLDMRYIDSWSLLQDLSLIARTVPVVLTGRGAS